MKKILSFLLIILTVVFIFTAYKYTIIRRGISFYFMEKNPPTFEEIYIDVTDWTFKDYAMHPKISAFLIAAGAKKKYIEIKTDVMKKIEKNKKEMEKMIEKEDK